MSDDEKSDVVGAGVNGLRDEKTDDAEVVPVLDYRRPTRGNGDEWSVVDRFLRIMVLLAVVIGVLLSVMWIVSEIRMATR